MKLKHLIVSLSLIIFTEKVSSQTNKAESLLIPFLDKESQSNVVVNISDIFGDGQRCPLEYTNALSNTNLFTPEEQKLIKDVFLKYKDVTTNSGPAGTVLDGMYKTNFTITAVGRKVEIEQWVSRFQYTNSDAHETIYFGIGGIGAEYRTKVNDGYNADLTCTGSGSLLQFYEVKHNLFNGLKATFDDNLPQGTSWDYRLADFDHGRLVEYRQYTNGMLIGKYLMWNLKNGNLMLKAEFKEPYDFEKHRVQLQL
jgi:hypothetical protein